MASGDTSIGTGATLTFAGFAIELTSISIDGPEATVTRVPYLALAAGSLIPKIMNELIEPGTISCEGYLDGSLDMEAVVRTSGTLTIVTGAGDSWAYAAAICTSYSAAIPLEDVETCSATWEINGALSITPLP